MQHDNSIAGLAMVLAKNNKIKVTVSGEGSYCDGPSKHINIACMEDTPVGRMLANGLVMHECGHMLHTNKPKPPGLLGDMVNVIEDVRVEALSIKDRPGTRFNLGAVTKHYIEKGALKPENINHALLGKVMAYGRGRLLSQTSITPLEAECDEMIDDAFGQTFIDELEKIIKHIPKLTNTRQTIAMADKVINLLLNPPPPPQQPKPQQGGGQGQGNQGTSGGQEDAESGEEDAEDGSPAPGKGKDEDAPSPPSKGNPNGTGGKAPTPAKIQELLQEESGFGDLSKLIHEEMAELARQASDDCPLLPNVDVWKPRGPLDEVEAISTASRMRAKMVGLLESVKRKPNTFGLNGKKIAPSQLVKLAFGDPRIFKKKTEVYSPNTAVVILCDYSGSMQGDREKVSIPACFALHHTLYGMRDVACCSMGFTGDGRADVHMLVDFGVKPKSGSFNHPCPGGTPMAEALWAARAKLLARPEPRKILLVLTDGQPDDHSPTVSAVKSVIKSSIDLAAIGIQSNAVEDYFPNHRVIQNLAELPKEMFSLMDEMLVKRSER